MRIITAIIAVAFMSGVAFAQDATTQSQSQQGTGGTSMDQSTSSGTKKSQSTLQKYSGTVESVDASAMTLSVKNKKGTTKDFTIGTGAKIMKNNKAITISDIGNGDHVTISYSGTAASPTVKRVTVHAQSTTQPGAGQSGSSSGTGGTGTAPLTGTGIGQ